jgi:hypothetical protein
MTTTATPETTTTETAIAGTFQNCPTFHALSIPQKLLRNALRIVNAARDDRNALFSSNPMSSVQMVISPKRVTIGATDARRLHLVEFSADNREALEAMADSEECEIPEFSGASLSFSVLIPWEAAQKLAEVFDTSAELRIEARRADCETFCRFEYTDGRKKRRAVEFQAVSGRYPRFSEVLNSLPEFTSWIEAPSGFLADMLRPVENVVLSIGESINAGFSRDLKQEYRRAFRPAPGKLAEGFRSSGKLEIELNGRFPSAFLDLLPEKQSVRAEFAAPNKPAHFSAVYDGLTVRALIMPLFG